MLQRVESQRAQRKSITLSILKVRERNIRGEGKENHKTITEDDVYT